MWSTVSLLLDWFLARLIGEIVASSHILKLGGSGGMLPQENQIYELKCALMWALYSMN